MYGATSANTHRALARQSAAISQGDGPSVHVPALHACRSRYVRQIDHASSVPEPMMRYGRYGSQRAIQIAPGTPKSITAQGPTQQNEAMAAMRLVPDAAPVPAPMARRAKTPSLAF